MAWQLYVLNLLIVFLGARKPCEPKERGNPALFLTISTLHLIAPLYLSYPKKHQQAVSARNPLVRLENVCRWDWGFLGTPRFLLHSRE
jgi:hypothetical protein